jgi:threonylcarbamoyladenosine tRNA methylthiotransferase MtaB
MASAVHLKSIGCRTNQEEMAALGSLLTDRGHLLVDTVEEADVVVVNTCIVTSATEAKTKRYLMSLQRQRPGIKICVTGCLAQYSPLEIKNRLPVRWVVGNGNKHRIPFILEDQSGGVFHADLSEHRAFQRALVNTPPSSNATQRTRFFLKIQEGCDCRCSYCIVPQVRGKSMSAPYGDVLCAFRGALDAGYKEIVLTGTHIGQFSGGAKGGFTNLVRSLAAIKGDFRLRLSSVDPRELSDELLDMIGSHPALCRHLHLSVQSLCPEILASMNRPIAEFDTFMQRLISFRRCFPQAGLGGDFIVGFPGETEGQFRRTKDAVDAIGFSYGHVFRYSKRPGTAAAAMAGQVDEKTKTLRGAELRQMLDQGHAAFIGAIAGDVHTLLVESSAPVTGLASNYLRMEVPGVTVDKNQWLRVKVSGRNEANGRCTAAPVEN